MPPIVSIAIDTEEDNWGSFSAEGWTVRNIVELPRAQEVFDRWGAGATYLVNYPPLQDGDSVKVLGELASDPRVEIGLHCHPWNTPPRMVEGIDHSMMFRLGKDENAAKIETVMSLVRSELGVEAGTFRAGRWGLGPSVARALVRLGVRVDTSVSASIDWTSTGGPDYSGAPLAPYRFDPADPCAPASEGALLELPATIGFLRGAHAGAGALRTRLERGWVARMKVVGLLDRTGLLAQRWLSPEVSSGHTMVRLAGAWIDSEISPFMQLTFHSSALLPGATPFVHTTGDRDRFLAAIDQVLGFLADRGCRFATLGAAAEELFGPARSETPGSVRS